MSLCNPANEVNNYSPNLIKLYDCLQDFVTTLVVDMQGSSTAMILSYLENHGKHEKFIRQDLLPLFVYLTISGQTYERSIPLATGWALYLAAAHFLDDAQDNGNMEYANTSAAAIGLANIALAQLQADQSTLRDILDAFGRVMVLGANAQIAEQSPGRIRSRTEYFQATAGKAAVIISTGVWAGGRLATNDSQNLAILREFGLAWGMAMQISDDCLDLEDDLINGLYTLPVIEGLSRIDHHDYPTLNALLSKTVLSRQDAQEVVSILDRMGTITFCKRLVRAYQSQASATFNVIPELAMYFSDYVTLT